MGTVEDQIKQARAQRAKIASSNKAPTEDGDKNGISFGTGVAYDDAYGAESNGGDYVSSLPTLDEERRMMMDDDDKDAGRLAEMEDAGRVGSHPSTLTAMKVSFILLFYFRNS